MKFFAIFLFISCYAQRPVLKVKDGKVYNATKVDTCRINLK